MQNNTISKLFLFLQFQKWFDLSISSKQLIAKRKIQINLFNFFTQPNFFKIFHPHQVHDIGESATTLRMRRVRRTDHDCFLNVLVREISGRPSHFSSMACLANLKRDIKLLESTFTKDHDRFQICSASLDELTCRFVGRNGEQYDIQANITVHPFVLFCPP